MKLNPEAEAEIERLQMLMAADDPMVDENFLRIEDALRAAMIWAYRDAARDVRDHWNTATDVGNLRDQAYRSANVIERLAGTDL